MIIYLSEFLTTKAKMANKEGKNGSETPNFQERMAKVVQVFGNLNKNLFTLFSLIDRVAVFLAVKKFCGSSLEPWGGVC
jgi:hypothetical protein